MESQEGGRRQTLELVDAKKGVAASQSPALPTTWRTPGVDQEKGDSAQAHLAGPAQEHMRVVGADQHFSSAGLVRYLLRTIGKKSPNGTP